MILKQHPGPDIAIQKSPRHAEALKSFAEVNCYFFFRALTRPNAFLML
jgi:hypothetical protein